MSTRLSSLLSFFISVDIVACINIVIWRVLRQTSDLFLSYLSSSLSTLHFPKLTVVHLLWLKHDSLLRFGHVRSIDEQVNVCLLRQLQAIDMINILPLQVHSYNALPVCKKLCFDAVTRIAIAQKGKNSEEAKSLNISSHFQRNYCQFQQIIIIRSELL